MYDTILPDRVLSYMLPPCSLSSICFQMSPLDRNIACDVLAYSIILVHVFVQLQRTHRRALNVIPVIGKGG